MKEILEDLIIPIIGILTIIVAIITLFIGIWQFISFSLTVKILLTCFLVYQIISFIDDILEQEGLEEVD